MMGFLLVLDLATEKNSNGASSEGVTEVIMFASDGSVNASFSLLSQIES
jgi:hypothetical protein